MNKIFNVCIVLLVLLSACKNTVDDASNTLLVNPNQVYLKTGDSIQFTMTNATANTVIKLQPNIGDLKPGNWYVAPSSIINDSTQITLAITDDTRQVNATITLLKSDVTDTLISFSKTILPLMVANCNFQFCHGNGSRAGKVELSTYDSVMKIVGVYQPTQSLLYTSLLKPDPLRRMPPAGPLHAYKINYIKKWIEQGALNN
ncbi:MAG: c-type cytochrome domain-containing protein [Bacteroidia bacterium]